MSKRPAIAIVVLALIVGSGCSGYGTIVDICQSETGEAIAFSTHGPEDVWVVTADSFRRCGKVPFVLSASGSLLVATSVQSRHILVLTSLEGSSGTIAEVDLGKAGITDGHIVQSVTLREGEGISLLVRAPTGDVNSVAIPLPENILPRGVGVGKCLPLDVSYPDSCEFSCRYTSRSGLTIVERRPSNRPATVSLHSPDGTIRLLLEESWAEHLRRRLAVSGFQYP